MAKTYFLDYFLVKNFINFRPKLPPHKKKNTKQSEARKILANFGMEVFVILGREC